VLEASLPCLEDSPLGGDVLGQYRRTVGGQAVGASTIISLKSENQSTALEPSEYLVKRARGQVNSSEVLNVLYEGVTVLFATREARENEYGGAGVPPQSFKRIGHRSTISISDLAVKDIRQVSCVRFSPSSTYAPAIELL